MDGDDQAEALRTRDRKAQFAQFDLFVRIAAVVTGGFGTVTLVLGLLYGDGRRLMMTAALYAYCVAVLACRRIAERHDGDRPVLTTAVLTLVGTVVMAVLHPAVHTALVMAALFPAAIALQYARTRHQWILLVLCWVATLCVALAAELVPPSTRVPDAVQQPFRLLTIAAASGMFVTLLWRYASRLFDRIAEARAGHAAAAAATAALAAEHQRLATTLASISDAVIVTDAEGRVTLTNAAADRIAGDDTGGRLVSEVYRLESQRGEVLDPVTAAVRDGRSFASDEALVLGRHDGLRFLVSGSAAPLRTDGGAVIGAVIVLRDVSERVQLEEELREAQKLDAIGRLAGGVAHDFNNQLTSILGYTELLIWTFEESDPRRQDMDEIRKAADRAALMTQQLLAFSRRQILQPRLVDVADVVVRSARLLHRMLPGNIALETSIDGSLDPVFIDPHQLGHVLLNLAVSAKESMPDGGTLSIGAARLIVERGKTPAFPGLRPGAWVELRVADTGRPIPPERLPQLFEPFADQSVHSAGSLELAVVHGIVTQSGGRIQARSGRERGTTFTMYFPAAPQASETAAENAPSSASNERVLLIEEDAAVRVLLAATLARQGYAVLSPATPEEALPLAAPVQAAIVDLAFADGRGEALATALARAVPGVILVYMSGRTEPKGPGPSRPDGQLLQKPFTPRDLLALLRETLDRHPPSGTPAGDGPRTRPDARYAG